MYRSLYEGPAQGSHSILIEHGLILESCLYDLGKKSVLRNRKLGYSTKRLRDSFHFRILNMH